MMLGVQLPDTLPGMLGVQAYEPSGIPDKQASFTISMLGLAISACYSLILGTYQTTKGFPWGKLIIPTLGIKCSHVGNKTFPAWEYPLCRNLNVPLLTSR